LTRIFIGVNSNRQQLNWANYISSINFAAWWAAFIYLYAVLQQLGDSRAVKLICMDG